MKLSWKWGYGSQIYLIRYGLDFTTWAEKWDGCVNANNSHSVKRQILCRTFYVFRIPFDTSIEWSNPGPVRATLSLITETFEKRLIISHLLYCLLSSRITYISRPIRIFFSRHAWKSCDLEVVVDDVGRARVLLPCRAQFESTPAIIRYALCWLKVESAFTTSNFT